MGTLYIVSTPIGNLEDITIRAIKTLLTVDIIACEDTRHTGLLIEHIRHSFPSIHQLRDTIKPLLVRFDEHTEENKISELLTFLVEGQSVALVSDAGTPLISDPGFRLVREAIKRNIKIESVPGASAVLTALVASGLPTDKFLFLGYAPEKTAHRKKLFGSIRESFDSLEQNPTIVFYAAPHKLTASLQDLTEVFGNISIVIARELTKIYEELWRGTIIDALGRFTKVQGEVVVLFNISKKG